MSDLPDELLELLPNAKLYERYILSCCPFHDDVHPSFLVYPDKYKCLSCGRYGDTSKLLELLDHSHVYPKKDYEYSWNNPFTKWLRDHSLYNIMNVAYKNSPVKYLEDRGISKEVQNTLKIGILENWVLFPIENINGSLIGAIARRGESNKSSSRYVLPHGQNPDLLYVPSWKRCILQDTIYLTYGILDAVTLYATGFASMSTTTGKRISPSAFDNIRKSIVIVPDFGEEKEAMKLASKLGWRGKVMRLDYPENCKDINDIIWYKKMNLEQLKEIING
jgi:hypothetical protein